MKFQQKLEQTKYGMTCRERKATTSTRHLVASTPTSGNLPCQRGRLLPTTKRYLRMNYHNPSRQIRRIPSPTFPLLLLYKRKDVGRKRMLFLMKFGLLWFNLGTFTLCSCSSAVSPSLLPPLLLLRVLSHFLSSLHSVSFTHLL